MTTDILRLPLAPLSTKIPEAEVTVNRLASILAGAVIETEIDEDGDIYASEGLDFPAWISVDTERKFLRFGTYCAPVEAENWPSAEALVRVNDLNRTRIVVQFYWEDGRITGAYYMTFDGGLDPRQFVKMLRRFSAAFVGSLGRITDASAGTSPEH